MGQEREVMIEYVRAYLVPDIAKELSDPIKLSKFSYYFIEDLCNNKKDAQVFFQKLITICGKMSMSKGGHKRKMTIFRLWPEDQNALREITDAHGITIQMLCEAFVKAYIDGDEYIMRLAERYKSRIAKTRKGQRYSFSEDDIVNLYKEMEQEDTKEDGDA